MLIYQVMPQFIKKITKKNWLKNYYFFHKNIFFCFDFRMKYEHDMFVKLLIKVT